MIYENVDWIKLFLRKKFEFRPRYLTFDLLLVLSIIEGCHNHLTFDGRGSSVLPARLRNDSKLAEKGAQECVLHRGKAAPAIGLLSRHDYLWRGENSAKLRH
jgi:hypothetical protein